MSTYNIVDFVDEWNEGRCINWCVQLPLEDRSVDSPGIFFGNSEWHFRLMKAGSIYQVSLLQKEHPSTIFRLGPSQVHCLFQKQRIISDTIRYIGNNVLWAAKISNFQEAMEHNLKNSWRTYVRFICIFFNIAYSPTLRPFESRPIQTPLYIGNSARSTPCLESISRDFSKLLGDNPKIAHDVELKCGDQTIRAHKTVLFVRSEVLATMLDSDVVELQDLDPSVLHEFVSYLYTGTTSEMDLERAKTLYEAGVKYAVIGLQSKCAGFFEMNLTDENACEILDLAIALRDANLKETVIIYIVANKVYLQDDRWAPFSINHPAVAVEVFSRFIELQK